MTPDTADDAHFSEVMPLSVARLASKFSEIALPPHDEIVELLRSTNGTPHERIAWGAGVALAGDERVPTIPLTTRVPGGWASIGIPETKVDEVCASWSHVGVERSWIEKETPMHRIELSSFELGTYPVTNYQYGAFLTDTPDVGRPKTWLLGAFPWDRSNHPVAGISVEDAQSYCRWLSDLTGRQYRLPTEPEWEYAARGSTEQEYPWGDVFDSEKANTQEFGLGTTSPVGCFPDGRSWCGVWDLAGNVEEFTGSRFGPYVGGQHQNDDLVTLLGDYHVTRGGSFSRFGDLARCSRRHGPHPGALYPCGFRVASGPEQKAL